MQRFLSITLALFIGLSFSFDAEARRGGFGGGKSFGAAPQHRSAPQQQRQQQQQQPAKQQGAGAKPALLGGLAGLAAGGLLAAMFMGGAFEGLQLFDILILGAIAFFLFRFIASRRQPRMQPAGPSTPQSPMQREMDSPFSANQGSSATAPLVQAPGWFNQDRFVKQAHDHFMQLQQLWDANDFTQIAEYLTPEMLNMLQRERNSYGDESISTYVEQLQVQLDGVEEMDDYTVASVSFTGLMKNSRFDQGETFHQSWRMERAHGDNQPWLIAGIQQNA